MTTLKIAVDKDPVNPQFHSAPTKKLRGTVFLYVARKADYGDLQLRLFSREHTHIYPKTGARPGHNKGYEEVINTAVTLRPAGTFEVGKYEFPFEMDIPAGLPATVCGGSIGNNLKKVNLNMTTKPNSWYCGYLLEARLHRPGHLTWDVFTKKTIRLDNEPRETIYHPVYIDPDHHHVRWLGCFAQGCSYS